MAEHGGRSGEDVTLDVGDRRRCADRGLCTPRDGIDLAGQRRVVDPQVSRVDQPCVGRDEVAFLDDHDVAGHQQPRLDLLHLPVSDDAGLRGQHVPERLDGLLGTELLDEREDRVEQDDEDDRPAERRLIRHERERRSHPQQEREHVDEVCAKPSPHGHWLLGTQHVVAVRLEPFGRLDFGQTLAAAAECRVRLFELEGT